MQSLKKCFGILLSLKLSCSVFLTLGTGTPTALNGNYCLVTVMSCLADQQKKDIILLIKNNFLEESAVCNFPY